jgi:spore germination cell wall hydrolase CwlJ-like protein
MGDLTVMPKTDDLGRPRYADLIDPDNLGKEQRCLAGGRLLRARSEPEEGQAAVAQVILNRMKSGLYPSTICGVVYQNRHRHLACQFHLRLRRQVPAHPRHGFMGARHARCQRRARGQDLSG